MKKKIIYFILTVCISGFLSLPVTAATSSDTALIRLAVNEYKRGNYISCISHLRKATNYYVYNNPNASGFETLSSAENNAVAWYYLGASYMKIGLKKEALEAFDRVISLNQSPRLTSYAIQAKMCMDSSAPCKYYNLKDSEITALKANPSGFLTSYTSDKNPITEKDAETIEIERLIRGQYGNNIHPEAQDFINQQKAYRRKAEMN